MEVLTVEKIKKALEELFSEEDLQPYRDLGNGLYELLGCVICNKKGLDMYLEKLIKDERG